MCVCFEKLRSKKKQCSDFCFCVIQYVCDEHFLEHCLFLWKLYTVWARLECFVYYFCLRNSQFLNFKKSGIADWPLSLLVSSSSSPLKPSSSLSLFFYYLIILHVFPFSPKEISPKKWERYSKVLDCSMIRLKNLLRVIKRRIRNQRSHLSTILMSGLV